jgi:hypothetical protein
MHAPVLQHNLQNHNDHCAQIFSGLCRQNHPPDFLAAGNKFGLNLHLLRVPRETGENFIKNTSCAKPAQWMNNILHEQHRKLPRYPVAAFSSLMYTNEKSPKNYGTPASCTSPCKKTGQSRPIPDPPKKDLQRDGPGYLICLETRHDPPIRAMENRGPDSQPTAKIQQKFQKKNKTLRSVRISTAKL